jgi:hypothetical protein
MTYDASKIPSDATGLRLCKIKGDDLILCEPVHFVRKRHAVLTILNRASINGKVGPVGETGDFWADVMTENGDWVETVALDRNSWNRLKNHWMRCKIAEISK